jgi:tetratricopeptide (TPR) repeat protein
MSDQQTTRLMGAYARLLGNEGLYAAAETLWRRACERRMMTTQGHDDELIGCKINLGQILSLQAKYDEAEAESLDALEKVPSQSQNAAFYTQVRHNIAFVLYKQGTQRYDDALKYISDAEVEDLKPEEFKLTAKNTLANILGRREDWGAAKKKDSKISWRQKRSF